MNIPTELLDVGPIDDLSAEFAQPATAFGWRIGGLVVALLVEEHLYAVHVVIDDEDGLTLFERISGGPVSCSEPTCDCTLGVGGGKVYWAGHRPKDAVRKLLQARQGVEAFLDH